MQVNSNVAAGFWLVFVREFGWLSRRRLLLFLITVFPLGLMAILTAAFSAGLATQLPIGVIDQDRSELSRSIIRAVDATPDAAIAYRAEDLAAGRRLILSGKIHGLLLLPQNLERDLFAGRRPEVVFFYNAQTMTAGNLVLRGVNAAIPAVSSGISLTMRTAQGEAIETATTAVAPIAVQNHAMFNPTLNYVHFLLAALLPSILQIVIVTASAYAVGLDVDTAHRLRGLRRLGGGLAPALAGKLLPYTIVFLLLLGLSDAVLFAWFGLPLRGSRGLLLLAGLLFVLSCQMTGLLLALMVRPTALAISISTLLTAPSFGFMGIGFPRSGMNWFASGWSDLLPGTWYLMARIDQTIRGTPVELSMRPILLLLLILTVVSVLVVWRLSVLATRASPKVSLAGAPG